MGLGQEGGLEHSQHWDSDFTVPCLPALLLDTNGACAACGGLVVPFVFPDKAAPSTSGDPPQPWDFTSVVAHVSLPLPMPMGLQKS